MFMSWGLVVQGLWLFYLNVFVSFFLEQRPQNVSCSTGVSVSAALGLHHQDQVWEQHNHTEVGHTILTQSYHTDLQKYHKFMPNAHKLEYVKHSITDITLLEEGNL